MQRQEYYNLVFNEGTMPTDICALPDPVYDELARRFGLIVDRIEQLEAAALQAWQATTYRLNYLDTQTDDPIAQNWIKQARETLAVLDAAMNKKPQIVER